MKKLVFILMSIAMVYQAYSQNTQTADGAGGLQPGTKAPFFTAMDADHSEFKLSEALKKGPVVLIFYRGHWCPVCNKHLAQIQDSLAMINEKGATLVAVSPEKPEYSNIMAENSGAQFSLLYDEGYNISDAYDVTFTPKKATLVMYNTMLGANLKEAHSDDSQRLPIPATYIIDQNGIIAWRHFNPDYKKRAAVKDILENIPE